MMKTLEDLRTLETELWTRHIEEQAFSRETYGARNYDPQEPTLYSQAAAGLGQLLDVIGEVIDECLDAEATAYATGLPWGDEATIKVDTVLDTLKAGLKESA